MLSTIRSKSKRLKPKSMETSIADCTFESQDEKQRHRFLYQQKRDKGSLQQTQERLTKQRKYNRQIRAKMTLEQHTALLLRIEKGITKNSTSHLLITMKLIPAFDIMSTTKQSQPIHDFSLIGPSSLSFCNTSTPTPALNAQPQSPNVLLMKTLSPPSMTTPSPPQMNTPPPPHMNSLSPPFMTTPSLTTRN